MPNFWLQDTRRRTIAWIVGIALTIVLVCVSALWLGGTPPSRIVLATGQPGGVYDGLGREYQKRLGAQGLTVELVNTAGSVDNFRRIIDGKADVAFAQSGTYQVVSGEVQALSRKLPLQQQQDVYHWRLHVSLILNEATERLGRMEAAAAR